jgi:hypothetical protein
MLQALTVHRPWPWAIAEKHKPVENRGWKPPTTLVTRHLAIHAGKTFDEEAAEAIAFHFGIDVPPESEHVAGAIVAVVRLAAIIMRTGPGERDFEVLHGTLPSPFDARWFSGEYGWCFDDVTEIEPVACRGMQGLWPVPADVVEVVRARWKIARAA